MNERGFSLVELVVVLLLALVLAAFSAPQIRAYSAEAHLVGAGQVFRGEFRKARSMATRRGVYTALRFESHPGGWRLATYMDGNGNGVRAADINSGIDRRIGPPRDLTTGSGEVRVGINPGTPKIPPDSGTLDPFDPIQFGSSNMLSFSPIGGATPGTFYLAGPFAQAAVRVNPATARVRLMVCRSRKWIER